MTEIVIPSYKCLRCKKLVNYEKCKDYECSLLNCPANKFKVVINKIQADASELANIFIDALHSKNIKQLKRVIDEVYNSSQENIFDFFECLRNLGVKEEEYL